MPTVLRTWRLRSSRAHSDRKPAVEVQQCPLRAEVEEEIGDELARRKWTWKLMQTWSRRNWRRRKRRRRRRRRRWRRRRRMRRTALIKSNNPHLAGGEKIIMYSINLLDISFHRRPWPPFPLPLLHLMDMYYAGGVGCVYTRKAGGLYYIYIYIYIYMIITCYH